MRLRDTEGLLSESEKVNASLEKDRKMKIRTQQKEWAEQEREQQRRSPGRVSPTKGTSDSWNGSVVRMNKKLMTTSVGITTAKASPFGPAPVFELLNHKPEDSVTSANDASPEIKFRKGDDGKMVVRISKTSDLILPYEQVKMQQYRALTEGIVSTTTGSDVPL